MIRITLTLNEQEKNALSALAEREFREPRAQAALIIHTELKRRGLIAVTKPPTLNAQRRTKSHPVQNGESHHDDQTPN